MAISKNVNDIILNLIDYLRTAQPDLDVKPGAVARDLFVDGPAIQFAALYDELTLASSKQSFKNVIQGDVDKFAANYGMVRNTATPTTGSAVLTFSNVLAPLSLNKGQLIFSKSGSSYELMSSIIINPSSSNFYKSIATKYKNDLEFLNITDIYAVEVPVKATTSGVSGNIGKYSLKSTNILGISNVFNPTAFSNGLATEDDISFKNRILAALRGSSVGTSLGYRTAAIATSGVSDAVVIEPGDSLMQRDGTEVIKNSDGSFTILSEGTGGKVDVIILGSSLQENTDTFIYQDKNNTGNAFDSKNNFVLGQISGDENKTINKKRIDNISSGTLPAQPVETITEVTGTESGTNFKPKSVDIYGRVTGNYEIIKDTGFYAGSPFGFDTFSWVSNYISDFQEDKVKGLINNQDTISFSDVEKISDVQQSISIVNENSTVTSDRSIIQLLHTPCQNVTRVFNVTTGERYIITNQNPFGTVLPNTSGKIKISGNNLPSVTDILQTDYSWIVSYDEHSDYDGKSNTKNSREPGDTIDWGFGNLIQKEKTTLLKDAVNNYYYTTTLFPSNSVLKVNVFSQADGYVYRVSSGVHVNKLAINISNLEQSMNNIYDVVLKNTNKSLFKSFDSDFVIINTNVVVGLSLRYNVQVILPTDTSAAEGDYATVSYNYYDASLNNTISGTQLTIPDVNFSGLDYYKAEIDYVANSFLLDSFNADNFPSIKFGNSFIKKKTIDVDSNLSSPKKIIGKVSLNSFSQYIVDLDLPVNDYKITKSDIISVKRLLDNTSLYDGYTGSIIGTNTYQVVLTTGSPQVGDSVIVLFDNKEVSKFQPFIYQQDVLGRSFDTIKNDGVNNFVYAHKFTNASSLSCKLLNATDGYTYASFTDGYTSTDNSTTFYLYTATNLSSVLDIFNKKIQVSGSTFENNGLFDVISYNQSLNRLTCKLNLDQLNTKQISVTRIQDGKEIFNLNGSVSGNKIILPSGSYLLNDNVFINLSNTSSIRKNPLRISCTVSDQNNIQGSILFKGTTLLKFEDLVYTVTSNGLKQNISEIFKQALNLNSSQEVPSNMYLANIVKCEKVKTISNFSNEVIRVLNVFSTEGLSVSNNDLYTSLYQDNSLSRFEFKLLNSSANNLNTDSSSYIPQIGDRIRVSGYIAITNDSEQLNFTKSGTNYTNKKFARIDSVLSLGGLSLPTTKIILTAFNQPTTGARYKVTYNYTAPKVNERISIIYNYNKTVSDTTLSVEKARPINADVLVKQGVKIPVDVTVNIVIDSSFEKTPNIPLQNTQDVVINLLNQRLLNGTIDASDIVNVAYSVAGVDRARVIYFNKSGESGQKLSLTAQKNEYFEANNVIINLETR